jgi:hypothetical protein
MKRALGIALVVLIFGTSGCASAGRNKYYADLAKEHDFEYYFPSSAFNRTFSTIEEAYDFIKTAQAKFVKSVTKPLAKGLAAKFIAPPPPPAEQGKSIAVGCFMMASSGPVIDLSKSDKPLELVLNEANSATVIFLVFYQDRGVSIPNYYLKDGYVFLSGNSQIQNFRFFGNAYKAEYPVGWGTEKAFSYLRKEID